MPNPLFSRTAIVRSSSDPVPCLRQLTLSASRTLRHAMLFGLLIFLLAACGPEGRSNSQESLVAATQAIAVGYQSSANLAQARADIEALDVANPHQWLVFVTESSIQQAADPATISALVKLSIDLDLASAAILDYALQNNLLPAEPVVAEQLIELPTLAPVVAVAEPVAAAAVADTTSTTLTDTTTVDVAATQPEATVEPTATATPALAMAQASDMLNVRGGPGTNYDLVGALQKDELVQIVGKNPEGDWWQVQLAGGQQGWVFGQLVQTTGDTSGVVVAANIPMAPLAAPSTAPPPPVAAAPPAADPNVQEAPAEQPAPAEAEPPAAEPPPAEAPAADPNAPPHFTLVSKRLWNKDENDGCRGKHLLRIHVLDAGGNRLNGVRLKGIYTGHEVVTGDQGKGDGIMEFDLHGGGEGFMVVRNNDGREVTSDRAEGFTTRSLDIPMDMLIATGYCSNTEDCQIFYNSFGCHGHHSWEATFQRNY